ncbi:tetratricopeptide repeat protein 39C-like isoform X2 [Lineus longissimus]|uniref:tetratricopeptide repeat protein 39C-like isoform X2 n=1 Tax=Lineus longissimus TaxID=88925 RepID=UPI002B4F03DE
MAECATLDVGAAEPGNATNGVEFPPGAKLSLQEESELASKGVYMLLNNGMGEATELFRKYKHGSPLLSFGDSFVTFMRGIMTFEEEQLSEAKKSLQETEKRCDIHSGFFHSMKSTFSLKKPEKPVFSLEERLQRTIIVADCLHFQSFLTFLNQDVPSFIKGGWTMRKAWKTYEKTYKEINKLYENAKKYERMRHTNSSGAMNGNNGVKIQRNFSLPDAETMAKMEEEADQSLSIQTLERLLGSVSFGYGLLLLVMSCVPPKILKIIEFLGFEGDREAGVQALEFSSNSTDMKAPFATLSLLWYHTLLRSFFSLDGGNILAGTEEASALLEKSEANFPNAALFLFFKARVLRLKSEVEDALMTYNMALEAAADQREIQLICVYEIGWGCLMKLSWKEALDCFHRLKEESRWSKSYYAYLTGLCHGALGDLNAAHNIFKEVPGLVKRKNNQIEDFVTKKSERLKKSPPNQDQIVMLGLEVLYLWNALPTCTPEYLHAMLTECNNLKDKSYFHLRALVEGGIQKQLGNEEAAITLLEEAIALQSHHKDDGHVTPFAWFELGTLYASNPQTMQKGKECLTRAKDKYKDYDFENRLHTRLHAAIKQIKRDGVYGK